MSPDCSGSCADGGRSCPSSVRMISGIFFFAPRLANWATSVGCAFPSGKASSISCPLTPNTSVSTLPGFTLASSSAFVLQYLLHPVFLACSVAQQTLAPTGKVARFANRPRSNETGMDHAVSQQMRQPPAIVIVGLMPSSALHFLRVGQQDFYAASQHVEDGFPVRAGRLRHHVADVFRLQPLPQRFPFGGRFRNAAWPPAAFRPMSGHCAYGQNHYTRRPPSPVSPTISTFSWWRVDRPGS